MNGQGDVEGSSFVWIPDLSTAVTGDIVYNNVHLWMLETDRAARRRWAETIYRIAALRPQTVVAGHKDPMAKDGPGCLAFTRSYLEAYERAAGNSKSAEELVARIKGQFPLLNVQEVALQMAAEAAFAKNSS